jgi:hemolysin activation/secretion protein
VRSASRTGRRARALGLGLGLALGLGAAAQAQAPTPASPVEPAAVVAPLAALATVEVARYEVEGNTLIAPERLAAVLEPYTGRVTLSRLREAAATVQELYREDGWGGVVAFLPEQTLEGGVVRIRVVEGRLVRIDVTGQSAFSVENIRASLPALQEGSTPEVRRVDAQIQMANENPAKAVQVLLQPGVQPGELVAKVEVQELPVLRATARLDNSGGRSTGRWRAALGAQHANLFGLDHVGAIELQTAPENIDAVAVLSGSWRVPFYAGRWRSTSTALSNVDAGTVGTAAGDLSFSGRGGVFGCAAGRVPAAAGQRRPAALCRPGAARVRQRVPMAGLPDGACGSAGASVSLQPASLVYTAQAAGEWRWGFSVGLHGNLALGGSNGREANFEAVRGGAPRRYALVRGSSHLSVPVEGWGHLGARFSFQLSDRPLVPGELFGIGGAGNVRGFEERELAGDSGASLSLEAVSANLGEAVTWLAGADVRALLFADAGTVSNSDDAPCQVGRTSCRMGSLGLGLRGGFGAWQLRLDIARAFTFGTTTEKGDVRAHAALLYNF